MTSYTKIQQKTKHWEHLLKNISMMITKTGLERT
jgi:hypothetical protein